MIYQLTLDEIIAAQNATTFTAKIKQLNSVESECPCCGHKTVSYRQKFRAPLIPALRKLADSQRALTLAEIADSFPGAQGRYIDSYFAEVRHWGLARKEGKKWRITDEGRAFLSGNARIPQYKWQRDKGELPASCIDGPFVFVWELEQHQAGDKKEHMRQAVVVCEPPNAMQSTAIGLKTLKSSSTSSNLATGTKP